MISHVSTLLTFAEIFENHEKSRMEETTGEPENGGPQECCIFRDGVCVLVQLWPCLQFLFLVSCPARASRPSLVSVFVFVLVSWLSLSFFLFFSVSISVVSSLLRLALVGACPHPAKESRDALLPPLPLTKKTLL